ncbi:hypothetical protein T484DRAFT_1932100 [Baffinella frigidus]|nr:hypothetical protein T484DRAFT_1932100 [Cryptophyta sp. CCMP2293]
MGRFGQEPPDRSRVGVAPSTQPRRGRSPARHLETPPQGGSSTLRREREWPRQSYGVRECGHFNSAERESETISKLWRERVWPLILKNRD